MGLIYQKTPRKAWIIALETNRKCNARKTLKYEMQTMVYLRTVFSSLNQYFGL